MATFDKKDLEKMLSDIKTELAKKPGKKKIVYVNASSSTTVTASSNETITIQPPEGKTWRIVTSKITINAPSGATTGNHLLEFQIGSSITYFALTKHNYDKVIYVIGNAPHNDAIQTFPETKETWQFAFSNVKFSYDNPLVIIYNNNTDADQINTRNIRFVIEEEDEAE